MTTLTNSQIVEGLRESETSGENYRAGSYFLVEPALMEQAIRALSSNEAEAMDAARYRFLRDMQCNHFHLTRDAEHAPNYMTAEEYIESSHGQDWMKDTDPAEVQRMKDTNTIWCLQVYPRTPIGFDVWNASTLDAAIDAALAQRGERG